MKRSEPKVDPKTGRELVLARLVAGGKRTPSRAELLRAVAKALEPPLPAAAAKDAAQRALAHCERSGWVTSAGKRARPTLTAKARSVAPALFGRRSLSWENAQRLVALNVIRRTAKADKRLDVDAMTGAILAARFDVPESLETLPAVVGYLAWRALGVETTQPFEVEAVQRHLLRHLVPADVRVDNNTWRRMLAMRSLRATGHDAQAFTHALLGQPRKAGSRPRRHPSPSQTTERKPPSAPANTNHPRPVAQPSLADFAAAVHEAASLPTVARFHDDRAFIGSIWDHMRGQRPVDDMTLPEFKRRLIAAHRDGLLRITRADLVGVMDRGMVERSEARFQEATFHFVALDAGGVG